MKKKLIFMLSLLCTIAQGVLAQTSVSTEEQLTGAIADGANIQLTADIQLSSYLRITQGRVTIDLNGHKLSRSLSDYSINGSVIQVMPVGTLILKSSTEGGSIEGGKATLGGGIKVLTGGSLSVDGVKFTNNSASEDGGAIFVQSGTNVYFSNAQFINNSANGHAGAIWNNDKLTAIDCTFTGNTASDVGAIYNSVTADGAGRAILTGCTFTENEGTTGAGALANALGNTVMTISGCTIKDNIASGHGGGIWNGGTLSATDCTFENNIANDVGGIYNATDGTTAGNATLTGCTFTRNRGIAGAGALANALGATVMTIEDCTIENNTAYEYGAGIWNGGTLNVKGEVKVTGNKNNDNAVSNVYLKDEKVITLTGDITGSNIGVEMENVSGRFTSGYNTHHNGVDPANFFSSDRLNVVSLGLDDNGEAGLFGNLFVNYIERSWDSTHEKVASIEKNLKGVMIGYDATPVEGQYKEVTNAPEISPNEWFGMGGYSDNVPEFYVVRGNVNRETIVVQGKNVHLILCDDATLTLTGGLRLEEDNKLYIHCQSYGDNMGRLMVANKYENAAGIGSAVDEEGNENTVGELVIHGGHIEATGGKYAAGIGSCKRTKDESLELCKSITVYGGYVKATGGKEGAGIGVGRYNNYFHSAGGDFYLYDGTVLALGGESASGVGGGGRCPGINVTVYGGSLTALGGEDGAGIGSGSDYHGGMYGTQCGGTCTIFGGTVTAIGGKRAAGIGGGKLCGGAEVNISGGRVMASGGIYGAGIGGGLYGFGGVVTISGGTVSATGGEDASGIGGGYKGKGGDVNITGGTVIAQTTDGAYGPGSAIGEGADSYKGMGELYIGDAMMVGAGNNGSVESILDAAERVDGCWFRTYAEISPCTHPSGFTYTINEDGTHTSHCKHCSLAETAAHFNSDGTGTCVCGYEDGGDYYTITLATSSNGTDYEGVGVMANPCAPVSPRATTSLDGLPAPFTMMEYCPPRMRLCYQPAKISSLMRLSAFSPATSILTSSLPTTATTLRRSTPTTGRRTPASPSKVAHWRRTERGTHSACRSTLTASQGLRSRVPR